MRNNEMHKFEPKKCLTLSYKKYAKEKKSQIRIKKAPNTSLQKLCKEKNAKIRAKKVPNNTLQNLCQKSAQIRSKKHQKLPYKNYAKKKKMHKVEPKKANNTTVKTIPRIKNAQIGTKSALNPTKTMPSRKKKCTNSSRKST